ncbi:MAG: HAMP domain-containing protein [Gammaproteobacteria bacterium]|nr:HAMP domain-containing protein [Gammaproteobacteria bacterium]
MLALLGFVYWNTIRYLDEQTDQSVAAEVDEFRQQYRELGILGVRETIAQRVQAFEDAEQIYLLATSDHTPVTGNLLQWPAALDQNLGWADLDVSVWEQEEGQAENARVRMLAISLPSGYRLLVGRNLHEREELYAHALRILAAAMGLSLVIALVSGLVMSRGILRRIETINRTGGSIMAGHLEQRMPVTGSGDEFDQLAANLNAMLDQIQRLMEGMRQVTDNVAHDLRGPLNRLHSRLEVVLLAPRDVDEYRSAIQQVLADIDSLLHTFNALLSIAQAESGAERSAWEQIDLSTLAREIAEFYQPLAEDKGLEFTQDVAPGLSLLGNRHLLAQVFGNLLDNAVKYTPRGGVIHLGARTSDGAIKVLVTDNGRGVPIEMRQKVLERFVRLETSRTTPGNGLGLSLVRAVAQLHEAKLELSDAQPGLTVTLRFEGVNARPHSKPYWRSTPACF